MLDVYIFVFISLYITATNSLKSDTHSIDNSTITGENETLDVFSDTIVPSALPSNITDRSNRANGFSQTPKRQKQPKPLQGGILPRQRPNSKRSYYNDLGYQFGERYSLENTYDIYLGNNQRNNNQRKNQRNNNQRNSQRNNNQRNSQRNNNQRNNQRNNYQRNNQKNYYQRNYYLRNIPTYNGYVNNQYDYMEYYGINTLVSDTTLPQTTISSADATAAEESSTVAPNNESNLLMYTLIAAGSFVGLVFLIAVLIKLRSRSKNPADEFKYSGQQIGIRYGKEISFTTSGGLKSENSLKADHVMNSLKSKLTRADRKPTLPPLPPVPLLPGQIKMQQDADDPITETLE